MDGRELAKRFESLLRDFGSIQNTALAESAPAASFRRLLPGFREASLRQNEMDNARTAIIPSLLGGFGRAFASWRRRQEQTADEFNLLEVLGVVGQETMHSAVLAWLLARDTMRHSVSGTHGQGGLGLRLFIAELRLPTWYADAPYFVRTEVRGIESTIDIEVACRGQFIIHIENKIWSGEGVNQTSREWDDMARRADYLGISEAQRHALFLTPRGKPAADTRFRPLSWFRVANVFEAFAKRAKPPDVSVFCSHYAGALRCSILELDELEELDNGEATIQ